MINISLLNDPEMSVQEQALSLLRNLACGKETDIEDTFSGLGNEHMMDILHRKLESQNEDIVTQAIYPH